MVLEIWYPKGSDAEEVNDFQIISLGGIVPKTCDFQRQVMLKRQMISMQRPRRAFAHPASGLEVTVDDNCGIGEKNEKKENIVKNSGEATTSTEASRDIRRPSRFSSSRFYRKRIANDIKCQLRLNSGSVRSGTERATASISRPNLRTFRSSRPDSTSSASFSVSSSISTSTSSQRTPRRSLFGTTDRRKFFARRRLWILPLQHVVPLCQYKTLLTVIACCDRMIDDCDGEDADDDNRCLFKFLAFVVNMHQLLFSFQPFQRVKFTIWLKQLSEVK